MVGINWKDIMLGTANPATDQEDRNPSKMTEAAKENGPCCGWRYVQNLCISPDGSVWTHYYGVNNPNHLLGNLESSIDELKQAFIKSIMKSPFVNDSRCTNCKALIYCWGLFCFARWKFVDNPKPSNFCAYNEMQAKIAKWDCDLQINPIIRGVTI
jgi:radical SAM protein with 4Fe4S-binding SPASM domain